MAAAAILKNPTRPEVVFNGQMVAGGPYIVLNHRVAINLEELGILREFSEPRKLVEFSGILCNVREKL